MSIPNTVREFLARSGGQFKVRVGGQAQGFAEGLIGAGLRPEQVVQATAVADGKARLLVIHAATHSPDLDSLNKKFRRNFTMLEPQQVDTLFPGCDRDAYPPLPGAFGLKGIVDVSVDAMEEVYFSGGRQGVFVRAQAQDFERVVEGAWRGHQVARVGAPVPAAAPNHLAEQGLRERIRSEVERLERLPAMPGIAAEILTLRRNPYANISELSAIIEQDPSLSAQIIRYAASPLYAYQGRLDSVDQAIGRVLGLDFVMDIAFGIALGRPFRNVSDGPLGLTAFWNHAVSTAALSHALCMAMSFSRRPAPGMAYLAGLLHNFGFLVLGHLFPGEFARLNRAVAAEPQRPIEELEREVVKVSHTEVGAWLMAAWNMPTELREAVSAHHDPDFDGDFSDYANLVCLANRLLARHGMGDEHLTDLPAGLLARLGLSVADAQRALDSVLAGTEELQFMARKMAA